MSGLAEQKRWGLGPVVQPLPLLPAIGETAAAASSSPKVYKTENKKIMSSYDDWLKTMVKSRPGAATQG